MECIRKNRAILGLSDDKVFIDKNHDGVLPTARRAWSAPTEASHILVLQDDVELCNNFLSYCQRIVNVHPDDVIGLYPMQFPRRKHVRRFPKKSPYVTSKLLSGQGIIMRADYVDPCLSEWDEALRGDDINIQTWAKKHGIQILTTLPALLQHIGDVSVYDPSRSLGRTDFFWSDPNSSDWDNGFVSPWTNVVR